MSSDRPSPKRRRAEPPSEARAPAVVGRLAPTPSGHLHLGNALAFYACWRRVRRAGGRLLLRFEDVDRQRSRAEFEASQRADLQWLGLRWDEEVPRQSSRDYTPRLEALRARGAVYVCSCSRKQVRQAAGPGGAYPGTCRDRPAQAEGAVRFRVPAGRREVRDARWGARGVDPAAFGDPVLRRRDGSWSYNMAVVADDIDDGVTEVVRGGDLLEHSAVQEALWEAMGAGRAPPAWAHTPLVLGPDGRKLAKSHGSLHLAAMRDAGWTAEDVRRLLDAWLEVPRGPIVARLPADGSCPSPSDGLEWTDAHDLCGAGAVDGAPSGDAVLRLVEEALARERDNKKNE